MTIRIVQGETATFTVKLRDENGDAFSLAGFDQYKICLPTNGTTKLEISEVANANGSIVTLLGTAIEGKLQVVVKTGDSDTLKIGERQDIGLILNNATTPNPRSRKFDNVLSVEASPC